MIWLFTGIGAKTTRPLYKRDLLNVCCEPEGAFIHFGYRKDWTPDGIKFTADHKRFDEEGKKPWVKPEYQQALIIFCEPVSDEAPFFHFHPVRLANIKELREEWNSYTFILELKGFFNYEIYDAQKEEGFQKYVLEHSVNPGTFPYKWVREELDTSETMPAGRWRPAAEDFSQGEWLPLVGHMRDLKGINDSTFFSVQKHGAFGGAPSYLFPHEPTYELGLDTYDVRGGKSYAIILYIIRGKVAEEREIELRINESIASVSGPFSRQRSSGMEADFNLVFKRSFQVETSMLELRIKRTADEPNQVSSPELQALIRVKVPWVILLVAVIALSIGGIFAVVSPGAVDELAKIVSGDAKQWIDAHKLLIFTSTKIVAFIAIGLGTFLGFNKLPIKSG